MSWSLLYLIFYATVFFFSSPHFSMSGSNETDYLALLDIKAKISHDPLGITSSWNHTLHFCEWIGVTCGLKHKRVITLDLSSSKLNGSLSPYIGNLSFLRGLYIPNNSFVGPIPPEIGRLHRLQYLALFNNSFEGKIPSNISSCYNLMKLSFSYNKLVGGIPPELGSLLRLRLLSLNSNNLGGAIPSSLGNLSSLRYLSICNGNLVGKIPDSLGRLSNLAFISLCANKLSGEVPPSIFNLSFLQVLDLGENQLEGRLPLDLGTMFPYLTTLALSQNHFTGSIPASMSNSSTLETLLLNENSFQGQVPLLDRSRRLYRLGFASNFLGNGQTNDLDFVYSLHNSTMLQSFEISANKFKGAFPEVLCNFSMLTILGMEGNEISGLIPSCIGNLVNLEWLEINDCQLSGIIPKSIGQLKKLYYFSLFNNHLSGPLPRSLGNLTHLSHLLLQGNKLEGQIPSTIGNCGYLQELDLANNNLRGNIPSQIFSLSGLSIVIDLSYNRLTGPLPSEVGQMIHLGALFISQNMLSGEIPSSLSACVDLVTLHMEGNFFQGTIPSSLNALVGLQELNLSHNNLSGTIPDFLAKFQLQQLDLSYNNLEGEVPAGGIFSNATGLSIFGNNKLCGGMPLLNLPQCNFNKPQKRRFRSKLRLIIAIVSVLSGVILLVSLALLYAFYRRKERKELPGLGAQDSGNTLPKMSYQSLLKATDGFASENSIGSGTFGVVYKATMDEGRTFVAIKKFKLEHKGASKSFMAECEVLRNIRHRNLVKVITACSGIDYQGNDFKALVYEYMGNGSLEDWLHPQPSSNVEGTSSAMRNLNLVQRLDIAVDVGSALEYLHHGFGDPIVHCDLKPSNVLLDDEMVAHVGDFGLAKFLPDGTSSSRANQSSSVGVRGTVGYAPPEYGLGNELSKEGDVYSFGILLLEMFTGKRPTDDMFKEGLSLRKYVKVALEDHMIEVVDSALLGDIVGVETVAMALGSVLEIALSCSAELQKERMDMRDVATKLSSIRNKLVGTNSRRRGAY